MNTQSKHLRALSDELLDHREKLMQLVPFAFRQLPHVKKHIRAFTQTINELRVCVDEITNNKEEKNHGND